MIPYIGGEEEKSEQEPLKLWGHIDGDKIVPATAPSITAPVSYTHLPMTIYDELKARGLIAQVTDEEEIKEVINNGKATLSLIHI